MAINRESFLGTDLDQSFTEQAQLVLQEAPTIARHFNREYEERARTNDNVTLDNYHFNVDGASPSTMRVVAGAYKDDYEDVSEFSVSQQSFKIDRYIKPYGFKVYRKDILRAGGRGPRRVLDGQSRMANLNVTWREQELISYLDGLATYTTNEPAADDLPKLDNSGSNGNAGKIYETSVAGATFLVNGRLKGNNTA